MLRIQFAGQRLTEQSTGCTVSRQYSQNSEKPHISTKLNIPPLTNGTRGNISIAKQQL